MKGSHKNRLRKNVQTRAASRPILEALEQRLQLGDAVLGGLLARSLFGVSGSPLGDRTVPIAGTAGERVVVAAAASPVTPIRSEVPGWPARLPDVAVDSQQGTGALQLLATSWTRADDAVAAADPLDPRALFAERAVPAARPRLSSADPAPEHRPSADSPLVPGLRDGPRDGSNPTADRDAGATHNDRPDGNSRVPILSHSAGLDAPAVGAGATGQGQADAGGAAPVAAAPGNDGGSPAPATLSSAPTGNGGPDPQSFADYPACAGTGGGSAPLLVPSENAIGVLTPTTLVTGAHYTLVAAGDVQVGALPTLRSDAQYQDFAAPRNMSADGTTQVGLKVEGAFVATSHPIWGSYSATHTYSLDVVGQGGRARIYYSDSPGSYGLHHGSLVVRILGGPLGPSDQPPIDTTAYCGTPATPVCDGCDCQGGNPAGPGGTPSGGAGDWRMTQNQQSGARDESVDQAPGSCTGPSVSDSFSDGGVRWGIGDVLQSTRDLFSGGFGQNWGWTRSFANDPVFFTSTLATSGHIPSQQPYLIRFFVSGAETSIGLVTNGINIRYFNTPTVGSTYAPTFFVRDGLQHVGNHFILTTTGGKRLSFFDFSFPSGKAGKLDTFVDAYGLDPMGGQNHTITVTRDPSTFNVTQIQRNDPNVPGGLYETYNFSYTAALLTNVTLQRGATPPGPVIRQVSFTYYPGGTSGGNAGDLESATVSDAAGNALDTTYYRYFLATDPNGFMSADKMVVGPQSFARLKGVIGNPLAPNNPSDSDVSPYADYQYQYFSDQRVKQVIRQGAGCTSCSGGQGTFTYTYTPNPYITATDPNIWSTKTVETLPDGNTNTVYTNSASEPMLKVFQSGSQQWEWFDKYDADGRVILKAPPSALSGFDEHSGDLLDRVSPPTSYYYLNDSSGRIALTDYGTSTTATQTMPGDVIGYYKDSKLQQGKTGTPIWLRSVQYLVQSTSTANGGQTIYPIVSSTSYRNANTVPVTDPTTMCFPAVTDQTNCETTTTSYSFWSNASGATARPQSITISKPLILSGDANNPDQHGPGGSANDVETANYDVFGRVTQFQDADGFIRTYQYDPGTGVLTQKIEDPGASPHLNLTTTLVVDGLGRTKQLTDPVGNIMYAVYKDTNYEIRVYPGWQGTTTTGPIRVFREDRTHSNGEGPLGPNYPSYTEVLTMSATPCQATCSVPDGTEAISGIQSLTRSYTSRGGQVYRTDAYFNLPDATYSTNLYAGVAGVVNADGSVSGNYWMTQYAYDKRGRQKRVQLPTGTIYRAVYDGLSRLSCNWVGTSDTDWPTTDSCGLALTNMVQVSALTYDFGGVGDSNLTGRIDYPSGWALIAPTDERETATLYDWRDRPVLTKQGVQATEDTVTHRPIFYTAYDNLDEVTSSERYDGDQQYLTGWPSTGGVPNRPGATLLRAKTTPQYDNQMRVFESNVFSVDQTNGTVSANSLKTDTWYNHRGLVMKTAVPGGIVTKTSYDGASRPLIMYTTDGLESGQTGTSWQKAQTIAGDTVVTQTENQYDNNGNVIRVRRRDRFHDATQLGALLTPNLAPKARVSYVASYYDRGDRLTDRIDVGTVGGLTSGQSTGGNTTTTLNDTTQTWQTNQWAGLAVEIVAGTGVGQVRTIASNTNNQLTVTSGWDTVPDATSLYAVAYVRPATVPARSDTVLISSYGYKADAVTRVALTATGGTFKLIYNGTPTAAISYNAAASDVQSALQAVVGTNNVLVSGPAGGVGVPGGPWLVRFAGSLAEMKVSDLTGDGSGLTGGALSVVPQSQGGDGGRVQKTTDPRALISKTDYDAMGRTLRTIDNFVAFAPSDGSDRQTEFTYDGSSHVVTRTAKLSYVPVTSVETTQYTYGVTRDSSCNTNANSCLNSNELLASMTYPGQAQPEAYAYNALGQTKTKKERNYNTTQMLPQTHLYSYDVLGRQTADAVSVLGDGVDPGIQRLETAYDTGGRPYLFTSYDSSSGGTVKNQVLRQFNGLSQLTAEYQNHAAAVNTGTDLRVQYVYSEMAGGANHSRLTQMIYPNTQSDPNPRKVNSNYTSGLDNSISRLTSLQDNGAALPMESLSYLGLNTVVKRAHPEPNVDLSYINVPMGSTDSGDQYNGLDRFGRVLDQYWAQAGTATDWFRYNYDRDSNRLTRNNRVRTGFDEVYGHDSFNQVTSFTRSAHAETWSLDNVGNWKNFSNDQTGPPSETRGHNAQNQINSLTPLTLTLPTYDANGNTKRDEWNNNYNYDAWNRLAQATVSSGTQTYNYDALNRRITENPGTRRDLYYSKDWQVLEERVGNVLATQAVQDQNVWSVVYVDALILRDRDPNGGGTLSERMYVQQDANWNVTAIISGTGAPQERYVYDPYGKPAVLDPVAWTLRGTGQYGTSSFAWVYLHQGGRYTRFDDLSGLYYFRNRDLSPTLGRWMEEDPLQFSAHDDNFYRYERALPTTRLDPLGLVDFSETDCRSAKPKSDKSGCSVHHGTYLSGYDAECVCKCAGTSDWENFVRACLECAVRAGVSEKEAHDECYKIADDRYGRIAGWRSRLYIGYFCACCLKDGGDRYPGPWNI